MTQSLANRSLDWLADFVGQDWKGDVQYYSASEGEMDRRWTAMIWPFVQDCDFRHCLDLAAGHGRNTRKLLELRSCRKVYVVDINQDNIDFCVARFQGEPRVVLIRNDGVRIPEVAPGSITMFYCFDAMVHFDSDVVRSYLAEVRRLLEPTVGRAFLHHSNYIGSPGGDFHDSPHWRNFMSIELMAHYAAKEGLVVEKQRKIDWNRDQNYIDAFTLLRLAS
ncbi:MAG TPA: class I SAM-dependent methyltransferase [Rhizomicrobium sp.]|jgi:SAM-dependent methyltransferase